MTTLYDVLEVAPDASQEAVEEAYREKVKEYHPDVSDHPDAEERFRVVKRAEEVLGDPDERARYDRLGHESYRRVAGAPDLADWPTPDDSGDSAGEAATGSAGTDSRGPGQATGADDSSSDHSRGISIGSGSSDGSDESTSGDDWFEENVSRDSGSAGQGTTDETDWWDDVWDAEPSDPRGGSMSGDAATASGAAGRASGATGRTSSAAGQAPPTGRRRPRESTPGGDDLWSAEVAEPVETTSRRERLAERMRSGEAMVLVIALLIVYPVFVYFSLDTTLSPAVNVLVGVTTIGVAVTALTRPAVSLTVFGVWSFLSPLLLAFLGQPVVSFRGLIVIAAFWLPLTLTVLVVLAAPR